MKKREAPPPSDSEITALDKVPPEVAARYIGCSPVTIFRALQQERAPFGFAVENPETGTWTFNISPGLLVAYKNGTLPTYKLREIQELAVEGIERIVGEKLGQVQRIAAAVMGA